MQKYLKLEKNHCAHHVPNQLTGNDTLSKNTYGKNCYIKDSMSIYEKVKFLNNIRCVNVHSFITIYNLNSKAQFVAITFENSLWQSSELTS